MKIIDINSIPRGRSVAQKKADVDREKIALSMKRRQRRLYIIGLFVIVLSSCLSGWYSYQEKKDIKTQNDCFQAVYYFQAEDFSKALEGDGVNKGLLAIVKEYPYTKTANLANFYIGTSYMHQKEYDKALEFLGKAHFKDFILQARSWCVMGDVYSEQNNHKQAAAYYMKAAHYKENSVYTPGYLVKAAIAFEAENQYKDAYHCYQEIVEKYPNTHYGNSIAIKESSRLSALL